MTERTNRRGSVLLMAIGLLTIVAILASTFLILSDLDARETVAIATKANADVLANSAVSIVAKWIGEDRYARDGKGPYGKLENLLDEGNKAVPNAEKWIKYTDIPYDNNERDDIWLSSEWDPNDGGGVWGHLTNLAKPNTGQPNKLNQVAAGGNKFADADGDELQDAFLYDPFDKTDPEYYVAVRVVDLASRICVNTAGDATDPNEVDSPNTITPAFINLSNFLHNAALYDKLHSERAGNATLKAYDANCARKLLSPDTEGGITFKPFALAEEPFFLWCKPTDQSPSTHVGRLHETFKDQQILDHVRRRLTTFSCTGAVVRHPDPDNSLEELTYLDVRTKGRRDEIRERMREMLKQINVGADNTARDKMASHFVANLWAYQDSDRSDAPWEVDGGAVTVFGLEQDLVITEVFARHEADIKEPANQPQTDTHAWGYALEISNPSLRNLDLGDYRLEIDGNPVKNLSGSLGPADPNSKATPEKVVLYSFEAGADSQYSGKEAEFFGTGDVSNWKKVDNLDFSGGGKRVVKLIQDTHGIPIDQVSIGDELGYSLDSKDALKESDAENKEQKDIQRDDRIFDGDKSRRRARYNLGVYARYDDTPALGIANFVKDADALTIGGGQNDKGYSAYIARPKRRNVAGQSVEGIDSIGELCNIYLAGPEKDGDELPFTKKIVREADGSVFKDILARGRLGFCPEDITEDGYASGVYPDVPSGTLYAEFFTHVKPHHGTVLERRTRVYGLINVNTASLAVLEHLPWPKTIKGLGNTNVAVEPLLAARAILNYRNTPGANASISGLRKNGAANRRGFLTPGEVAIPLGSYVDQAMQANNAAARKAADYMEKRNALYAAVGNCLTTRSDVFAVHILVQYGEDKDSPRQKWYYLAVIDRSSVRKEDDSPAVLLFTQVH